MARGNLANFGGKKAAPFGRKKEAAKRVLAAHKKGQKWTPASDAAWDAKHGVKEGSAADKKLDAKRGVKDFSYGPLSLDLSTGTFHTPDTTLDLGKDGSKWKHGYIPLNAIAVAIKNHHATGGSGAISHHGPKGTATIKKLDSGKHRVIRLRSNGVKPTTRDFDTEAAAHEHAWNYVGGTTRLTSHGNGSGKIKDIATADTKKLVTRGTGNPANPTRVEEVPKSTGGGSFEDIFNSLRGAGKDETVWEPKTQGNSVEGIKAHIESAHKAARTEKVSGTHAASMNLTERGANARTKVLYGPEKGASLKAGFVLVKHFKDNKNSVFTVHDSSGKQISSHYSADAAAKALHKHLNGVAKGRGADLSVLTTDARKNLKPSDFVFPAKKAYPIPNLDHARNALARSSGKPEANVVRAAVIRKYPQLKKSQSA